MIRKILGVSTWILNAGFFSCQVYLKGENILKGPVSDILKNKFSGDFEKHLFQLFFFEWEAAIFVINLICMLMGKNHIFVSLCNSFSGIVYFPITFNDRICILDRNFGNSYLILSFENPGN